MEYTFQNTTNLDKKVYYSFVDFYYKQNWIGTFLYSLIVGGIIFPLIFGIPEDIYDIITTIIGFLLIVGATAIWIIPYLMRWDFDRQILRTDKRLQTPMAAFYTFNEDEFGYTMGTSNGTVPYNAFYRIYESEKYFFLMSNSKSAYIVDKKGFAANGSSEQFSAFIAEKVGRNFYNKSGKRKQIK